MYQPGIVISVEQSGGKQEIEVLVERGHLGLHLSSVPESRTMAVIFIPWIEDLVGIFTYERVTLHCNSHLHKTAFRRVYRR